MSAQAKALQGRLALRELTRLLPLLASSEGEAAFTLEFREDADGRAVIHGEVQADLPVICQRCLEVMTFAAAESFDLAVVRSIDEANRLPEHLEPLLLQESWLDPRDIVADELILALPTTPRHADAKCAAARSGLAETPATGDEAARRTNPFAVLSSLKRHDGQDET